MAKKYDEKRKQAEDFFVLNGLTAKEISELFGVTEKTIGDWRKAGEWDKRRKELLTSPTKLKELLTNEAISLASGEKAKIDADSLSKVMSAIDRLSKRISASVACSLIQELDTWLSETDPETAVKMLNTHKQFLMFKIKQESGN